MPNIVKITTFPNLLDLLTPHSCRGCGQIGCILCDRCKKHIISTHQSLCPNCKSPTHFGKCLNCPDLPPVYIIGERTGLLSDIVHDYKYHSIRALAHPLAELMHTFLPQPDTPSVTVPLPTIDRHIRARGFDHTKLIAKHLAKLQGPHCTTQSLLIRTKNTTQVGTNRTTRINQAADAYAIAPHTTIDNHTTYILLDDVWTTGASMRACIEKLRHAGAQRITIALLSLSRLD
ncbi:ComF family protein [Candidatus Saccharibacteria bacterium]|nr:ComF family protein [Candidatus Saccharibacteria bacterium]